MSRIGRAVIELLLKGHEQTNAQLKQTKKELNDLKGAGGGGGALSGLTDEAGKAGKALSGVGTAGTAAGATTAGGMAAAAASIAAVAAAGVWAGSALYTAFDKFINRAEDARAAWDAFAKTIRDSGESALRDTSAFGPKTGFRKQIQSQLDGAQGDIERFAAEAAKKMDNSELKDVWRQAFSWSGFTDKSAEEVFDKFQREANRRADAGNTAAKGVREKEAKEKAKDQEEQARREREAALRRAETNNREIERLNAARLSGEEKIKAERLAALDAIDREEAKATDPAELDSLKRKREATRALFDYELSEWRKNEAEKAAREKERIDERMRREKEAADRIAQQLREGMERAADAFAAKLAGATRDFQNAQRAASNNSLDQLVATVQSLRSLVDARLTANGLNTTQNDYGPYSGG